MEALHLGTGACTQSWSEDEFIESQRKPVGDLGVKGSGDVFQECALMYLFLS